MMNEFKDHIKKDVNITKKEKIDLMEFTLMLACLASKDIQSFIRELARVDVESMDEIEIKLEDLKKENAQLRQELSIYKHN